MNELREPFEAGNSKGAMFYAVSLKDQIIQDYFLPSYWQNREDTLKLAEGRSATYRIKAPDVSESWVLRQYYRGGLFGKFVDRTYLYYAEKAVRSVAEWRLLNSLFELGLSVPKPVAAIYWRTGMGYQAALLTQYIPESRTLSDDLCKNIPVNWQPVAEAVKNLHRAGCLHGDLNAHNILLHAGKVTVIDFDKSRMLKSSRPQIQKKNLLRLKRSILKLTNWPEEKLSSQWAEFISAYTSA